MLLYKNSTYFAYV